MATQCKTRGVPSRMVSVGLRLLVSAMGLGTIAWGAILLPYFWDEPARNRVTAEIVQGHTFARQTLLNEAERASSASAFCDPARVHDAVILRLATLQQAITISDQSYLGAAYGRLYDATRAALGCSPADGFAWLTLFWLEVSKHGYQPQYGQYLRLSYKLAPYEGWIALWRSKLAIAILDQLPDDLAAQALREFSALVETERLYPESLEIFASAPSTIQTRLAEQLKTAKPTARQVFARMLYDRGSDVTIPGANGTPSRPWR
jgi:hypothetical protein